MEGPVTRRTATTDAAAPKAPRTAPPEVRRRQIIEATITSISRNGLSGTTLAEVTRLAGLSLGLANFHFKTRDALLCETLAHIAHSLRDHWQAKFDDPALKPTEKLAAIVEAHFDRRLSSRKKLAVWFAFFGEAAQRQSYRALLGPVDRHRLQASTELCRQIVAEGGYATEAEEVALGLEGLYDGLWLNILVFPSAFSHSSCRAVTLNYLADKFPRHFMRQTVPQPIEGEEDEG